MEHAITPEPRWPGVVALLAVAALNGLLPASLSAGLGWAGVAVVAVLASLALIIRPWHDKLGHATAALVTVQLAYALARLILYLINKHDHGIDLLRAAVILWSMNIFVFASWYWRIDAGGPHHRSKHAVYCGGAFLFPQLSLPPELRRYLVGKEGWQPRFIDYLFLAFNTSTAFSPTDAPVLSAWAKVLMMVQASISLATLAMVAARAVNIL